MRRRPVLRVAAGILLLVLALGAAALAQGVGEAARAFRVTQAQWQRTTVAPTPETAGRLQSAGERLLGIAATSRLQRAYTRYQAGLADVIPGTTYPQTQARWDAIRTVGRLRSSLGPHDRSAADVVLGRVYATSAEAAGPTTQRQALRDQAIAALRRAVLEDPASVAAKHDLELLLAQAGAAEARARRDEGRTASGGTPAKSPRSQVEGSGY